MTIAQLIGDTLKRKGISQSDLARGVGVGRQSVSKWLAGGPITAANIAAVAKFLGMDPLILLAAQTGYIAPAGDYLSPEAQSLARRFQALPDEHRTHVRWLVDCLLAISSPHHQDFEKEVRARAAKRTAVIQK